MYAATQSKKILVCAHFANKTPLTPKIAYFSKTHVFPTVPHGCMCLPVYPFQLKLYNIKHKCTFKMLNLVETNR